jgi:hypothetical protein
VLYSRTINLFKKGWEDNIKMDLQEVGLGWACTLIDLPVDRNSWRALVNAKMNLPYSEGNF